MKFELGWVWVVPTRPQGTSRTPPGPLAPDPPCTSHGPLPQSTKARACAFYGAHVQLAPFPRGAGLPSCAVLCALRCRAMHGAVYGVLRPVFSAMPRVDPFAALCVMCRALYVHLPYSKYTVQYTVHVPRRVAWRGVAYCMYHAVYGGVRRAV